MLTTIWGGGLLTTLSWPSAYNIISTNSKHVLVFSLLTFPLKMLFHDNYPLAPPTLVHMVVPGRHSAWVLLFLPPSGGIQRWYTPLCLWLQDSALIRGVVLSPLITDTFGSTHDLSGPALS